MSKSIFSVFLLLLFTMSVLNVIEKAYEKTQLVFMPEGLHSIIKIPRYAQDTITEIPIVREFDRIYTVSACVVTYGPYSIVSH